MIRSLSRSFVLAFILAITLAFIAGPGALAAGQHSPKKGIGMGNKQHQANWPAKIKSLHVSWLYCWGPKAPEGLPKDVEFVPMIWGYYGEKTKRWCKKLKKEYQEGKVHYLLGYNEPDGKKQANMPVEKAVKTWPVLEATGIPLGSPACVHPDKKWMTTFMKETEARHGRVDFVCVHSYGGANPQAFLAMIKRVHELYHKPIWITEFAVGDWHAKKNGHNKYTPQQVAHFMEVVLPALDKMPYVQRYAWFPARQSSLPLGPSALFKPDGSLTKLGKIYAAH